MLPPTTMAPPVITAVGRRGVNRHGWDDEAKHYTWSAVKSTKCPDCPSCYVTAPLFTGNRKVSRDVSRALGRAARVELRSRLVVPPRRLLWAGRCRHRPPPPPPPPPPAFLPPTNRMSQTDTRTLAPEKGLGKYGARGETAKLFGHKEQNCTGSSRIAHI